MSTSARPTKGTRLVRRTKFYFSPKNIFTKEDRRFHLGWKRNLCIFVFSLATCWFLDLEGKFDLAKPLLAGLGAIFITVQLRWHLRSYVWFWVTLVLFFTLYSVLIFGVSWDTDGPSRGIIGGLMVLSIYPIFVILHAFEAQLKETSKDPAGQRAS